jgi:hypothetical protein
MARHEAKMPSASWTDRPSAASVNSDLPRSSESSGLLGAVASDVFVVGGVGLAAAVEDADEAVAEGPEGEFEPIGEEVTAAGTGIPQSSVSRRFVAATPERLAEFRARPLDEGR